MPSYKVLKPGFMHNRLYDPNGKRPVLHLDKPFPMKGKVEQVPSWLERIKDEKPAARKRRAAATKKAQTAKKKQDKEVEGASFMDTGGSKVETL